MVDLISGLVVSVAKETVGTQVSTPALVDDSALVVDDTSPFNPTGGTITIDGGDAVTYDSTDDNNLTIYLTDPLPAPILEDAEVLVEPPQFEWTALVLIDDESDPIPATVPYNWQDALRPGIREEEDRERVRLTADGDWSFAIFDVISGPLVRSGPTSIPTDDGGAAGGINEFGDVFANDLNVTGTAYLSGDATMVDGVPLADYIASLISTPAGQVTKTYPCLDANWWEGDNLGTARVSDNQYVGYASSQPDEGNRRSAMWFDTAAIQADLAGRTVTKVRVKMTVWEGGNDKTVILGSHGDPQVRASWNNIVGKSTNLTRKRSVNEGTTLWVDISAWAIQGWKTGAICGLVVGPGQTAGGVLSNDGAYHYSYRGPENDKRAVLEITSTA